jgi:hypothetical protein
LCMFVRPRNALSGWLDWGVRLGCYLTRT